MSHRTLPSGFVKSVLNNGIGRHVCQLQRITLSFCKSSGSSRGLRDFVDKHLMEFSSGNPGIAVYLDPKHRRPAKLVGEYLNGNRQEIAVAGMTDAVICQWVEQLRTRSGLDVVRLRKTWHTDVPSIQGIWEPYTNCDSALNVASLPDENLSRFDARTSSASEALLQRAASLRVQRR